MIRIHRCTVWAAALLLGAAALTPAAALIQPQRSAELADLEMRQPQMFIQNAYQKPTDLAGDTASMAARDLAALGLRAADGRLDLRTNRWGTLILSEPMIPGTGVGNDLSWVDGAPADNDALKADAWRAFVTFLEAHRAELRIDPAEIGEPRLTVRNDGGLIQIWAPREIGGIPVRDAFVTAVINHGNLILLGAENWAEFGGASQNTISEAAAAATVADHLSGFETGAAWAEPSLVYVPVAVGASLDQVVPGRGLDYRLAWQINPVLVGDQGRWQGLVDAANGELLSFRDTNHYGVTPRQVEGGVYPVSNDGMVPDGVEQLGNPMPFDDVSTPSGTMTTDTGGNLPQCVNGNITSNLDGQFVRIADNCGSISLTSSGDIDFGGSGGDDCTTPGFGGAGNTHSARSGFYELNRIKEQARAQLPANGWLTNTLIANMNINSFCNAFWNGSTVNFYRSGGGCANTGELAGVFDHEWGHGMDDNDNVPNISNPGEGIADVYAALRLNTSCIGRGFFDSGVCGGYGDPCISCDGIRDIDWAERVSGQPHDIDWIDANCGFGFGPCGGIVHCEGSAHAEATWDMYTRDLPNRYGMDSNTALEATTRINYVGAGNVSSWFQCTTPFGGCNASSGYMQFLAADDDNGNLNDGTPHMQAIFDAHDRHQIACDSPVVQDSGCADTPGTAPNVTATPGPTEIALSWNDVSADSYNVYRTEGVFACDFGKVLVGNTTGTSFTDTGLQAGRDYSYIVIPMGSGDTCWGPASSCTTAQPDAAVCDGGGDFPKCLQFNDFCDSIQIEGISGGVIDATWNSWDCAGTDCPMAGLVGVSATSPCDGSNAAAGIRGLAADGCPGDFWWALDSLDGTMDMVSGVPPGGTCFIDELAYTLVDGPCTGLSDAQGVSSSATAGE